MDAMGSPHHNDLAFRCLSGERFFDHYSRTSTEPPIDVIAFLKPLVTARSAQLTARATDIMVENATSEKVGIASSDRRRRGRSGGAVAAMLFTRLSTIAVNSYFPCSTVCTVLVSCNAPASARIVLLSTATGGTFYALTARAHGCTQAQQRTRDGPVLHKEREHDQPHAP